MTGIFERHFSPNVSYTWTANQRINGKLGIGVAPTRKLDVLGDGIIEPLFRLSHTQTDLSTKFAIIAQRHYNNTEEDVGIYTSNSGSNFTTVNLGGGHSSVNACTIFRIFTAADNITTAGTERMRIDSAGLVGIGTAAPAKRLTVLDASDAQLRLVHTLSTKLVDFTVDTNETLTIAPSGTGGVRINGKFGFGLAPVAQQAHIADPTDLATCITAVTAINAMLETFGFKATS